MNQINHDNEYILLPEMVILSSSDLKGNITDYNKAFKEASGYSDEELIGRPHNILRHPDMPKEAFKDFWQTIQAGYPWFGLVKNKRKNGQYYWVAANATPIIENHKVTGYLSVRYPASPQQKQLAESLYAAVREGKSPFPYTNLPSNTKNITYKGLAAFSIAAGLGLMAVGSPLAMITAFITTLIGVGYLLTLAHQKDSLPTRIRNAIENLANGQFKEPIADNTELGFRLNMIRSRIAESAARNYDQLQSAEILNTAMNAASTNMMVADNNFNITSINSSLLEMFRRNQQALQSALPGFKADDVVGSNMDIFHQKPQHQRAMVSALTQKWSGELKVAGLVLRLTVVPIQQKNKCLGYIVEWLDRTEEAQVASEINRVMTDLESGNYHSRVEAKASGELARMKQSINESMDILSDSVQKLGDAIGAQAQGDLTFVLPDGKFKGKLHDLKNALNYSLQKLSSVINVISDAADTVYATSAEVAQASIGLSSRVQEQAAALEQTSATMEQMNSTIQQTNANTQQASSLAIDVQKKARKGSDVMKNTIAAMQGIKHSSQQIAEIVSLIDGIAFQTNLLALNAAVEAARAGDNGRGFAVVAGEVRGLAQKSAEAAKEIRVLITDSVNRIEEGTKLADESGEALSEITQSIDAVTSLVESIANATKEQTLGMHQVHEAITNIDGATQQNAALVEETAAAADILREQSELMHKEIGFFKVKPTESYASANPISPPTPRVSNTIPASKSLRLSAKNTDKNKKAKTTTDEWAEF